MIVKVISGGQTGVDQAALRAARACGIPTGGYAPKGWVTEDGPAPWLAEYGLTEHLKPGYPPRTRANVGRAHATLILDEVADHTGLTGGTRLAFDHADWLGSRCGPGLYLADLRNPETLADCLSWLRECLAAEPRLGGVPAFVLNVAGPRESKSPGIGAKVERFLTDLFTQGGLARERPDPVEGVPRPPA